MDRFPKMRLSGLLRPWNMYLITIYGIAFRVVSVFVARAYPSWQYVLRLVIITLLPIICMATIIRSKKVIEESSTRANGIYGRIDGRYPWFKVGIATFAVGEIVTFLISIIPYGFTSFGRMFSPLSSIIYYFIYLLPTGREYDVLEYMSFIPRDFVMFVVAYIIYEFINLALLMFVYKLCYNRVLAKKNQNPMALDAFEYTSHKLLGVFVAHLIINFFIEKKAESDIRILLAVIAFALPLLVVFLFIKKRISVFCDASETPKQIISKILRLSLPGEAVMLFLCFTLFGDAARDKWGKAIAYPAYVLFAEVYARFSPVRNVWLDSVVFVVCFALYAVAFIACVYLLYKKAKNAYETPTPKKGDWR